MHKKKDLDFSDLITSKEYFELGFLKKNLWLNSTTSSTKEPLVVSSTNEGSEIFTDQILYRITQEGHANILGWLLYCAKESILRKKEGARWADEMLFFLNSSKACLALGFNTINNFRCIFERYLMWFNDSL